MARYIDADEALRMMQNSKQDNPYDPPKKALWEIAHDCCISCVDAVPTADVVEVKHGKWKQGVPYICSICGKPAPDEENTSEKYSCWTSPYCPHCGAKMDGGNAE